MSASRKSIGLETKTEHEFWDDVFEQKFRQCGCAVTSAQEANMAVAARKLAHGKKDK